MQFFCVKILGGLLGSTLKIAGVPVPRHRLTTHRLEAAQNYLQTDKLRKRANKKINI